MDSNLSIRSNLMPDKPDYLPEKKYIPGDLYCIYYGSDVRVLVDLTPRQKCEMQEALVCLICKKTCAGMCSLQIRKQ